MEPYSIKIEFGTKSYSATSQEWIDHYLFSIRNIVELDPQQLLEYGSEIKKSIERNLFTSIDFNGNPVEPLKPSTIKRKGHFKVFFDTGELYRSVRLGQILNGVEIFIADGRALIASILQRGNSNMGARAFFGITPEKADVILSAIFSKSLNKFKQAV